MSSPSSQGQSIALLSALRQGENSILLEYRAGRLSGMVDSLGRHIIVKHDETGRLVSLALSQHDEKNDRPLLHYVYNDQDDLVDAIDPASTRTQYRYDAHHRMVTRIDRRGYSFRYEYDSDGRCIRSGGEDGMQEVRLDYRPRERLTGVTWLNGGKWQFFTTPTVPSSTLSIPTLGTTVLNMMRLGRLIQELDPNKNAHLILYDDTGAPLELPIFSARLIGPPPFMSLRRRMRIIGWPIIRLSLNMVTSSARRRWQKRQLENCLARRFLPMCGH